MEVALPKNRVTLLPTASTSPAMSAPRSEILDLRNPRPAITQTMEGVPLMKCQSQGFAGAAATPTRTRFRPDVGFAKLADPKDVRRADWSWCDRLHSSVSFGSISCGARWPGCRCTTYTSLPLEYRRTVYTCQGGVGIGRALRR